MQNARVACRNDVTARIVLARAGGATEDLDVVSGFEHAAHREEDFFGGSREDIERSAGRGDLVAATGTDLTDVAHGVGRERYPSMGRISARERLLSGQSEGIDLH